MPRSHGEGLTSALPGDEPDAIRASVSPDGELHASMVISAFPQPRHQLWRLAYREDRYCRYLSQAELNQRIRDIVLNLTQMTPEAKIGLPPMNSAGIRWMVLFTHMLEEMKLRHGPHPAGFTRGIFHTEPYPDFAGELAKKAASALVSKGISSENVLIKYGKPEHMALLHEQGRFRVQPASYYSKPDHNGAVRDDELSLHLSLALNREAVLRIVQNPEEVPADFRGQRLDVGFQHPRDYWLYCLTSSVEPRHFVDFGYTACTVIRDRREFIHRIEAVEDHFFPNTIRHHLAAVYIDPLRPPTARINLPISKHFRFTYQNEFRFVWVPVGPVREMSHVDVEVGSLRDISEVVTL